ncbi:hypothetical protein [Amphibacillus cookii]|uniref:hypothetical protein n=1 Tax=Amphibacillus cookii TaxID=767787 RepID=UPI001958DF66|nr:hypothetical protein [Amphibacillus cookii]MBM7539907.1 hypothetical protein [Amphibacillus cookii]
MSKLATRLYYAIIVVSFLIPVFFFSYLFLLARINKTELAMLVAEEPIFVVMMLISGVSVWWGYLFYFIEFEERLRNGKAGHLLVLMGISQLLVGNIFMFALAILTKIKLPIGETPRKLNWKEFVLPSLFIFLSVLSGFTLWQISF